MQIRRASLFVFPMMILVLLASGCKTKIDQNLIGQDGCIPPCWLGLRPGITSEENVIQHLEEMTENGQGKIEFLPESIEWQDADKENYYLSFNNGILKKVKFTVDSANVEDLVTLFGEPSHLIVGDIRHGSYTVTLFYPDKGLAFIAGGSSGSGFKIKHRMKVQFAFYTASGGDIESMFRQLYVHGEPSPEAIAAAFEGIQEWNGYGTIPR